MAPNVLTVHLKRFGYQRSFHESKIGKHIVFPETLDLGPYMTDPV